MPKMGPKRGRGGGGQLSRGFNVLAAMDPTDATADFVHDPTRSTAFDGHDTRGSNFTTSHTSSWSSSC